MHQKRLRADKDRKAHSRPITLPNAIWQIVLCLVAVHLAGSGSGNIPAIAAPTHSLLSQAIPSQQGNQVVINGRSLPVAWTQWQVAGSTRIGISDAGLFQSFGVELLNTEDIRNQPVQWFSDPQVTPLVLPTRLTGAARYLDITDFARQMGWQMQVNGTSLQILSTPAKLLFIRQGKQPWGDRFVIELDRPAAWQIDQQSGECVITLDAQIDSATAQSFQAKLGNQITSFKLEQPTSNITRLRFGMPLSLRPRVWSLSTPNRLIIDVRPDSMVDRNIVWASGLRWRSQILNVGGNQFPVVWLTINPRQPGVSLKPILPNPGNLAGIAPLLQTARLAQVAAAINGGFFNRNNQFPLGAIRLDGRWLSGPILNRGAIAWNNEGEFKFDRLTLQENLSLPNGQRVSLTHLNSAYIQAGIARYTTDWGAAYNPLSDNEIIVSVQNNRVVGQQSVSTANSQAIPIPVNGYLLVLRSNRTAATNFPVGTLLRLESLTNPPEFSRFPQIVAAGPLLLQNRQIILDAEAEKFSRAFAIEKASRSAIGQTSDGNVILAAVHTRTDGVGATLDDIAQIMQQLGAVNALNLDGGSSTTLYLGGQILDRPSRSAARVHNGIGVFVQPSP